MIAGACVVGIVSGFGLLFGGATLNGLDAMANLAAVFGIGLASYEIVRSYIDS